jgi:uncharacterized membrane protein
VQSLIRGVVFVAPIYLAGLLLLKAMKSLGAVVRPLARLLPPTLPAETVFSFLFVLLLCLLVGLALQTPLGQRIRALLEGSLLKKIPGYEVIWNMTHQVMGDSRDSSWQVALVEIEDALVPAFIVEEFDDGRFTVFVPSVPTPLAGAIYILSARRVHPLDVPFSQGVKSITRWGSGCKDLVAAMEKRVHTLR